LVLDSGSTDGTVELAKKAGARVEVTDWPGYGVQQNRGIDSSTGDWIFSLDADERITKELSEEIIQSINNEEFLLFKVPRKSLFLTKFMSHSGWWPDRTKRLFKRGVARFTARENHAHLSSEFKAGLLNSHIIHYSYRNLDDVLIKMNRFSSGGARHLNSQQKKGSLSIAILHGLWAFVRTYFIKVGFLDGNEGLILSIANAETTYYKYLKLYFLQKSKRTDDN
jgi:glycosyltransferase involved in cell wall biosynthesis